MGYVAYITYSDNRIGIYNSLFHSKGSTRAGLISFSLGGLSSGFILLGSAFFYVNCGITSLDTGIHIYNDLFYSMDLFSVHLGIWAVGKKSGNSNLICGDANSPGDEKKRDLGFADEQLGVLNPDFITGFCDGESTFTISITKDNRERKTSRRLEQNREIFSVHPSFAISLNKKDENLIYSLQSYFCVGKIKQDISHSAIVFYVNSVEELASVIIPFFDKYPLITQKRSDFLLFKMAINLIKEGAHLTSEGLTKIVSIKASMNKGLSDKLATHFPNIVPVVRPKVENQEIKDPN